MLVLSVTRIDQQGGDAASQQRPFDEPRLARPKDAESAVILVDHLLGFPPRAPDLVTDTKRRDAIGAADSAFMEPGSIARACGDCPWSRRPGRTPVRWRPSYADRPDRSQPVPRHETDQRRQDRFLV